MSGRSTSPERATVPWTALAERRFREPELSSIETNTLSERSGVGCEGAMGKNLSPHTRYASALWRTRAPWDEAISPSVSSTVAPLSPG